MENKIGVMENQGLGVWRTGIMENRDWGYGEPGLGYGEPGLGLWRIILLCCAGSRGGWSC